ncbi:MAG: zinc transporter ZupT [Eubacteriales bacterium]|nr:zinc transporter ZupT [Eubacteriales bacterium]
MGTGNAIWAFLLTLVAGLSTGIGSLFVLLWKKTNAKILSVMLGLSAGVMIYVSFVDIFPSGQELLISEFGKKAGSWITAASFFGGMLLIGVIDKLIPSKENPHESRSIEKINSCGFGTNSGLIRTGMLTAIAIAVHNFPEGIATFTAALHDRTIGIPIAIAIALHNIPEGISVAIPVYCATGNRKKAFMWSFLSGLSEPAGALIAFLILMPFLNNVVFGILLTSVAGIMVYISMDELLPTAEEYGEHHLAIAGLIAGMVLMALSILVLT